MIGSGVWAVTALALFGGLDGKPMILVWSLLICLGAVVALLEIAQIWMPHRVAGFRDVAAGWLGILAGWFIHRLACRAMVRSP